MKSVLVNGASRGIGAEIVRLFCERGYRVAFTYKRSAQAAARLAEETGALADMLTRIANTYDDEVDNAVAGMTAAIEPALIIVLAVVVGTIVIAMFLPMIKIISSVSGAGG